MIRVALETADELCEWGAGAHLNQALVALVGEGMMPRGTASDFCLDRFEPSS